LGSRRPAVDADTSRVRRDKGLIHTTRIETDLMSAYSGVPVAM
jgi:hypothetical protein